MVLTRSGRSTLAGFNGTTITQSIATHNEVTRLQNLESDKSKQSTGSIIKNSTNVPIKGSRIIVATSHNRIRKSSKPKEVTSKKVKVLPQKNGVANDDICTPILEGINPECDEEQSEVGTFNNEPQKYVSGETPIPSKDSEESTKNSKEVTARMTRNTRMSQLSRARRIRALGCLDFSPRHEAKEKEKEGVEENKVSFQENIEDGHVHIKDIKDEQLDNEISTEESIDQLQSSSKESNEMKDTCNKRLQTKVKIGETVRNGTKFITRKIRDSISVMKSHKNRDAINNESLDQKSEGVESESEEVDSVHSDTQSCVNTNSIKKVVTFTAQEEGIKSDNNNNRALKVETTNQPLGNRCNPHEVKTSVGITEMKTSVDKNKIPVAVRKRRGSMGPTQENGVMSSHLKFEEKKDPISQISGDTSLPSSNSNLNSHNSITRDSISNSEHFNEQGIKLNESTTIDSTPSRKVHINPMSTDYCTSGNINQEKSLEEKDPSGSPLTPVQVNRFRDNVPSTPCSLLKDYHRHLAFNPGMLDDPEYWPDDCLRRLCQKLKLADDGSRDMILSRLREWDEYSFPGRKCVSKINKQYSVPGNRGQFCLVPVRPDIVREEFLKVFSEHMDTPRTPEYPVGSTPKSLLRSKVYETPKEMKVDAAKRVRFSPYNEIQLMSPRRQFEFDVGDVELSE